MPANSKLMRKSGMFSSFKVGIGRLLFSEKVSYYECASDALHFQSGDLYECASDDLHFQSGDLPEK